MKRLIMLAVTTGLFMTVCAKEFTMHATKYHPGQGGAGWVTASGARIDNAKLRNYEIRWVALSGDMFRLHGFKLGDTIVVNSERVPKLNGKWVVKDRMGTRRHQCIDFLLPKGDNYSFTSPTKVTISKQ